MKYLLYIAMVLTFAASALANESTDVLTPVIDQAVVKTNSSSTRFSIVNNQIIVPVVLRNNGRIVTARMILDTGASVTTIYSKLASELNMGKNKLSIIKSTSANGIKTDALLTKVDLIEVDDKLQANAEVIIMPVRSDIGVDGLLGNSFLKFYNFSIDYDNRLLRWN
jgi:hypothetical protein